MVFKIFLLLLLPFYLHADPWGKDADLKFTPQVPTTNTQNTDSPMSFIIKKIIRFHQTTLSPADGPRSHFRPSSSHYAYQAIQKYGILQGFIMGCDRLLRENNDPWVYDTIIVDNEEYKSDIP